MLAFLSCVYAPRLLFLPQNLRPDPSTFLCCAHCRSCSCSPCHTCWWHCCRLGVPPLVPPLGGLAGRSACCQHVPSLPARGPHHRHELCAPDGCGSHWRHHTRHPGSDKNCEWRCVHDDSALAGGLCWCEPDHKRHSVLQVPPDQQGHQDSLSGFDQCTQSLFRGKDQQVAVIMTHSAQKVKQTRA